MLPGPRRTQGPIRTIQSRPVKFHAPAETNLLPDQAEGRLSRFFASAHFAWDHLVGEKEEMEKKTKNQPHLEDLTPEAVNGSRNALEQIVLRIQDRIYGPALRMLSYL